MKKNKIILKHCPNFYKIINFEFLEEDSISAKLIDIYENFIFDVDVESQSDIKTVEKLDFVINKYIDDYSFRKEMQRSLLSIRVRQSDNIMKTIVDSIITAYDSYETGYTRNIYFARWI